MGAQTVRRGDGSAPAGGEALPPSRTARKRVPLPNEGASLCGDAYAS